MCPWYIYIYIYIKTHCRPCTYGTSVLDTEGQSTESLLWWEDPTCLGKLSKSMLISYIKYAAHMLAHISESYTNVAPLKWPTPQSRRKVARRSVFHTTQPNSSQSTKLPQHVYPPHQIKWSLPLIHHLLKLTFFKYRFPSHIYRLELP